MKKFNRIKKLSKTIFAIIAMIGLQATNTHAMKRSHSNELGNEQNITPHKKPSAERTENAPTNKPDPEKPSMFAANLRSSTYDSDSEIGDNPLPPPHFLFEDRSTSEPFSDGSSRSPSPGTKKNSGDSSGMETGAMSDSSEEALKVCHPNPIYVSLPSDSEMDMDTGDLAMLPESPVIRPGNFGDGNISPMPMISSSHFTVNTENFENYFEVKFGLSNLSGILSKKLLINPRLSQIFLNKEILQQFLIEKRSQIFSGFGIENPEISNIFNVFDLIIINSKIETGEHHLLNQDEWEVRSNKSYTQNIYINKNFLQKNGLCSQIGAIVFYAANYN